MLLTYPRRRAKPAESRPHHPEPDPGPLHRPASSLGVLGAGLFANAVLLPAIKKQKDIQLVGIASAGGVHARHSASKFGFGYAASDRR